MHLSKNFTINGMLNLISIKDNSCPQVIQNPLTIKNAYKQYLNSLTSRLLIYHKAILSKLKI